MHTERLSLFQLQVIDGKVIDQHHQFFDATAYSQFKYGVGVRAMEYAQALYALLHEKELTSLAWKVTASAYKYIPTASQAIAGYLYELLEQHPTQVEFFKIHRDVLFSSDYGKLSMSERQTLMAQTQLYLEKNNTMQGESILVIDDIRITGTHEEKIRELLAEAGAHNVCFVYIAEMVGECVPMIENLLNHCFVSTMQDLADLFSRPDFIFNTRVCKFILSYPIQTELVAFLENLSAQTLQTLVYHVCADEYHLQVDYLANYQLILTTLEAKIRFNTLSQTIPFVSTFAL